MSARWVPPERPSPCADAAKKEAEMTQRKMAKTNKDRILVGDRIFDTLSCEQACEATVRRTRAKRPQIVIEPSSCLAVEVFFNLSQAPRSVNRTAEFGELPSHLSWPRPHRRARTGAQLFPKGG